MCWTTYANRLHRLLNRDPNIAPIVRTQYTSETTLWELHNTSCPWPNLARARLLLQVVFNQGNRVYHFLRYKETLEQLEQIYATNKSYPGLDGVVVMCKLFALFAIGEAYSAARANSSRHFDIPGSSYYMRALDLMPILPERPNMIHVETLILLVYMCPHLESVYTRAVVNLNTSPCIP